MRFGPPFQEHVQENFPPLYWKAHYIGSGNSRAIVVGLLEKPHELLQRILTVRVEVGGQIVNKSSQRSLEYDARICD